ncbi:DUF192 domain-containing protein [Qipengyuania atrilutea]|uniref:DUF192 domain-containing protein n=1 Tax=Qipengyuania atrilutea TaxID=2744473 RepID=A0A850H6T6_9SPHN|nr:DUF192 domain-containing protein [Actirhodobacter atriluteus]NVD45513.1 DUF192 domain-containing protein [Actirhodobacter atriluteus]
MIDRLVPIALVSALLAACSPQAGAENTAVAEAPAQAVTQHPVSGLEVVPLTIDTGEQTHRFRVEVARSREAQSRGLMERPPLGDDEGMIFPYKAAAVQGFWMKNTPSPLDIIFVGEDGRILNIITGEPYSEKNLISDGHANLVLEIRGGRAAELGIEPGDVVAW